MIAAVHHTTTTDSNWPVLLLVGVLVALAMILGFLLLRHDREVGRTKVGFFIERHRHDDPEQPWPELRHTSEYELPTWVDKPEPPTEVKEKP